MKKMIARSSALLLMALVVAACKPQGTATTTNISTDNSFVSDETSDGNAGQIDNLATPDANLSDNEVAPSSNTN